MKVVIIGGSGHVGTYLVPRLVEAGHQVTNVTRGQSKPYLPNAAWKAVQSVQIDRERAEADGSFGQQIAALQPDIVIDMVCFTLDSAQQIVAALQDKVQHFLHCGTMWVHGYPVQQPTTEDMPRKPFPKYNLTVTDVDSYLLTDYGVQKAAVEAYLLDEARRGHFPATVLHPGHIVGPGHNPVNPQGNDNLKVFEKLAQGEELLLPNIGLETVHHVHGDDVAQTFMLATQNWSASVGEAFHVVSPAALTLRGYAEAVAVWFGQVANLQFVSWDEFCQRVPEHDWSMTWDHIAHSPNGSIAKAQRLLGYQPRYTSLQAIFEALQWFVENQRIRL
ncbi:MAG: NAD-dependent epimerase/dehydratase family protein [Burkholderiales bacterium]|nr:NAD-dependent epimerase/dehydratase family protein [Anaerolineae bacterium]